MEKNRQTRIMVITALMLAVLGMTLGFAAFSKVLTISSSATVTPNSEDFKMKIYGLKTNIEWDVSEDGDRLSSESDLTDMSLYSENEALPFARQDSITGTTATINNSSLIISNLKANFIEPGDNMWLDYLFIVKNEGKYDAYLDLSNFYYFNNAYTGFNFINATCTAGEGTTQSLVDAACDNIGLVVGIVDSNRYLITTTDSSYKIAPDEYIYLYISLEYYGEERADGPFSASFNDIKLNFSTASTTTE